MSRAAAPAPPPFRLSSLTLSVYLPTILFSIGQGAVIPVIPLFARELGSSVAAAGLIVGMRGLGQLIFDVPAGLAVSKWGDKGAMVTGTALIGVVAVGASFSPSPAVLALLIFLMGGAWAFWQIARLAYVSEAAPLAQRGRALSMLGGMNRVGNFIGPLIGGLIGQHFGLESAFIAQAVMGMAAAAMMFFLVEGGAGGESISAGGLAGRLAGTAAANKGIFARATFPIVALALMRQARQVFLPLWGEEIGLDIARIGLLTSVSFCTDAAVFLPAGVVMDRFGRKWAAVPCLLTLALGLALLPLTDGFYSFMAIAVLTGVGNGFGSGINMTLGADFAPPDHRGEFLGLWRVMADTGQAIGPMVVSLITTLGGLAVASLASGGIGLAGAAAMVLLLPETLRRGRPRRDEEEDLAFLAGLRGTGSTGKAPT